MEVYVIRHVASGQLMPEVKRGRGYSHWNPSRDKMPDGSLKIPRLFPSIKAARCAISGWWAYPNATMRRSGSGGDYAYEYDEELIIKGDNRVKEDLEIVKFKLEEVPCQQKSNVRQ